MFAYRGMERVNETNNQTETHSQSKAICIYTYINRASAAGRKCHATNMKEKTRQHRRNEQRNERKTNEKKNTEEESYINKNDATANNRLSH